ncbi:HAD family hydrolase [Microvirga guangxiensis]|uniref:Haloacid dehalogenase superfamily, subfamily IA, variant 3 with third motif having DD or ED n=1 Tax=Microvirga guangxiensis TaxID=549386 RepID=A0A1G5E5L2_9HYPH|nr:HAD family phosphatase [Microvirga guangxiensis]SCY22031.1 haloacid dehalogenase superfamily, subfamily IA, variant 3 with third motif having DD or ED [Microvirga guangxiensis]
MSPELVIFDCDGVLVDSEILASQAMCSVLQAQGVAATPAMVAACVGMKRDDILARIASQTGTTISPETADDIWPATRALFVEKLKPTPGVPAFLSKLPYRRCVASSSDKTRIRLSLEVTGLLPFFGDDFFSSHEVERGKPAPDLFLHAARQMGVRPENCVVIEDSPFGVQGARAAGMTAIGYIGGSHLEEPHAEVLLEAGAHYVEADWNAIGKHIGL